MTTLPMFFKECNCLFLNLDAAVETDTAVRSRFGVLRAPVGGQAVIEGVVMRAPERVAMAVRKLDGTIKVRIERFTSLTETRRWSRIPLVRGAVSLMEMMYLGVKTMSWSANETLEDYGENCTEKSDAAITGTMVASIAMGVLFFFALPMVAASFIASPHNAFTFNAVAGVIRMGLFLAYLWSLSKVDDIKRLFQYHGSEHKSIYAFETGKPLTVDAAKTFTTFHPRCGTSFLLSVMVISVFAFSAVDYGVIRYVRTPTLVERFFLHLPFIPLVGSIAYEAIRLSARFSGSWIGTLFAAPGLWLQRFTTAEPDEEQLEVALESLKASLGRRETVTEFAAK